MLWWKLWRLKSKDPCTRRNAAEKLAKSRSPTAVASLFDMLRDRAANVRFGAVMTLGMMRETQAAEPLVTMLGDQDSSVRMMAAESLGMIGDPQAVEPLIVVLNDSNKRVVTEAVKALGVFRDGRAVEPLLAILSGKDPYLAKYAALALGQIGDRRAFDSLKTVLVENKDSILQQGALEAIVQFRDPSVTELIGQFLGQMHGGREAVHALAQLGTPRALELIGEQPIKGGHNDDDAIRALEKIGNAQAVTLLVKSLNAKMIGAQQRAADALGRIGSAAAAKPLLEFAGNPEHAAKAIEALERVLTQASSEVADDVLAGVTSLQNIKQREYEYRESGEWTIPYCTGTRAVDCSKVRKMAQQELSRRMKHE